MADNEQIEIDLDDTVADTTDIEVIKVEDEPEPKRAKKEIEPEEGLEDFKAKYENERSARIEAERRARESAEYAARAQGEVQDGNLSLVTSAIQTISQNSEILKANYRDSMAVGDYDRAADIQAEMASNAVRMLQLEQGKQALENEPRPTPQTYTSSDPVEALASQLSPRSADWVRRHPEYATDQRLFNKMVAAHNLAVADGIPADSREYFENIEDTLRIRDRGEEDASSAATRPVQRRSAPPAAPVSRSGNGAGGRPNTVRLNASEREMAQMMGMTDQEYARNKLALQKEGKMH
jgi:hypothetical protein